jgi:hypothetical protein
VVKFHAELVTMGYIKIFDFSKTRVVLVATLVLSSCIYMPRTVTKDNSKSKPSPYRKITLEEMVRRYVAKTHDGKSIEGIYTVSSEVIKKGKGLLDKEERERVVDRKNNYATVAILKDWPGSTTEYVEISLHGDNTSSYPIISEINSLAGEQGYIFNHVDKKGGKMPFTFTADHNHDVLEGVYTEKSGNKEITYKLSYLKTYPKNKNFAQEKN